jgi:hypothetical protein
VYSQWIEGPEDVMMKNREYYDEEATGIGLYSAGKFFATLF